MGRLTRQTSISVPVEKVYGYVADPRNAPNYISSIVRIISGPEGQPQEGGAWRAEANFLGKRSVVALRLTRLTANQRVTFTVEGEPRAALTLTLAPAAKGSGTNVSLLLDVPSVPEFLLSGLMGGLLTGDLARLRRALEG
ncbi:MAG TPA: SRPBCC family protein [Chloroflexia bacterium]|nr:SRPBCC family protein [Chloroflexia bacterium]